jgi:hypothetical protein
MPPPDALAAAYGRHGLSLIEARPATPVEVAASVTAGAAETSAPVYDLQAMLVPTVSSGWPM